MLEGLIKLLLLALFSLVFTIIFIKLFFRFLDWAEKNNNSFLFKIFEFIVLNIIMLCFILSLGYYLRTLNNVTIEYEKILLLIILLVSIVSISPISEILFADRSFDIKMFLVIDCIIISFFNYIDIYNIMFNCGLLKNDIINLICSLFTYIKYNYSIIELIALFSLSLVVYDAYKKDMRLICINFFDEFKQRHSYKTKYSISDYIYKKNYYKREKNKIINYLNSGFCIEKGKKAKDFISGQEIDIKNDILSDGLFAWYRHLSYYVDKYEILIDIRLLNYIKSNNYKINYNFSNFKTKYINDGIIAYK